MLNYTTGHPIHTGDIVTVSAMSIQCSENSLRWIGKRGVVIQAHTPTGGVKVKFFTKDSEHEYDVEFVYRAKYLSFQSAYPAKGCRVKVVCCPFGSSESGLLGCFGTVVGEDLREGIVYTKMDVGPGSVMQCHKFFTWQLERVNDPWADGSRAFQIQGIEQRLKEAEEAVTSLRRDLKAAYESAIIRKPEVGDVWRRRTTGACWLIRSPTWAEREAKYKYGSVRISNGSTGTAILGNSGTYRMDELTDEDFNEQFEFVAKLSDLKIEGI